MTRERAKELLPIIQGYVEGKEIQSYITSENRWSDDEPEFYSRVDYRIKPDPGYKPYSKVNPEWVGKVINSKVSDSVFSILSVIPEHNKVQTIGSTFSLEKMFEYFTWADGSPFGEEV